MQNDRDTSCGINRWERSARRDSDGDGDGVPNRYDSRPNNPNRN